MLTAGFLRAWLKSDYGSKRLNNKRRKRLKTFLYKREEGKCFYCGEKLTIGEGVLEHIIPRSRGGRNVVENVVFSCVPCDVHKKDHLYLCGPNLVLIRKRTGGFMIVQTDTSTVTPGSYRFYYFKNSLA